jgi:hypothetical protein
MRSRASSSREQIANPSSISWSVGEDSSATNSASERATSLEVTSLRLPSPSDRRWNMRLFSTAIASASSSARLSKWV